LRIQNAINAAQSDDTINIYPGEYTESAVCPWPMCGGAPTVRLFINQNDITLLGVDEDGNPVDDAADVQVWIAAAGKADFSFLNVVVADDALSKDLDSSEERLPATLRPLR
jgi:hypothetical protein